MAEFKTAYAITQIIEGGWVNDPDDKGKETAFGVSRRYNPNWSGWIYVDQAKKKSRTPVEINKLLMANPEFQKSLHIFYEQNYWNANNLTNVASQDVANEIYDTGVNCGVRKAAKMAQEAINLLNPVQIAVDGIIGPKTLSLLNSIHQKRLFKTLNGLQFEHYVNLVRKSPSQKKFFNSWLSRVSF